MTSSARVYRALFAAIVMILGITSWFPVNVYADTLVFPYIADGKLSDGSSYTTSFVVYNRETTVNDCGFGTKGFTDPLPINLRNNSTQSVTDTAPYTFALTNNGWQIIRTSGTSTFRSAIAFIDCSGAITAQAIYTAFDAGGRKLSETPIFGIDIDDGNVLSDHIDSAIHVVADLRNGEGLGLAITNVEDHTISLTISLRSETDTLVKEGTISIPAYGIRLGFVDQLVQTTIPPNFVGRVVIFSNDANLTDYFSVTGLRFLGSVFSTVPAAGCNFRSRNCP
jgi:hypothetical protein